MKQPEEKKKHLQLKQKVLNRFNRILSHTMLEASLEAKTQRPKYREVRKTYALCIEGSRPALRVLWEIALPLFGEEGLVGDRATFLLLKALLYWVKSAEFTISLSPESSQQLDFFEHAFFSLVHRRSCSLDNSDSTNKLLLLVWKLVI